MSLKVSFSFLILGYFLTFSDARVADHGFYSDSKFYSNDSRIQKYDAKYESILGDGYGKSFRHFTYEVEKSFKELTQNSGWIYHLISIIKSGYENGFETITSWPVDLMMRVEFFVMADGYHFVFPLSEKYGEEKYYKAVAKAVSYLFMNLKTMERVDKVMKNATKILLSEDFGEFRYKHHQKSPEKFFGNFLHKYFEIIEEQMEADEVLREEYRKRVSEAKETVESDPKMYEPLDNIWETYENIKYSNVEEIRSFFEGKETFHRAIANKLFMKKSVKHFSMIFRPEQHQRYLLARALIQKAVVSTHYESKVNDVYRQALVKAGEVATDTDFNTIRNELFKYLENILESEPVLYAEVKILMKQIEKTSAYDANMYIDFSIL